MKLLGADYDVELVDEGPDVPKLGEDGEVFEVFEVPAPPPHKY